MNINTNKDIHPYASLHNHTDYSNLKLIDCINKVPDLIDYAYTLGVKGLAITDHDTLSAHVKALQYVKNKKKNNEMLDFKLILGNEIYISREGLTAETHQVGEKFYHCILLAKDAEGHKQLRRLSSRAWSRSYIRAIRRTPTYISDLQEIVGENPGHLICTTACLGSYPGTMFTSKAEDYEQKIEDYNNTMYDIFGKDYFIEIQPGRQRDQIDYNKYMITEYRNKYPFVITTDAHYLTKEERSLHSDFLRSKPGSESREVDSFYGYTYEMSSAEIYDLVKDYISLDTLNKMFDNTITILNEIEEYDLGHVQLVPKIKYEWENRNQKAFAKLKFQIDNAEKQYPNLKRYFQDDIDEADHYLALQIAEGYYSDKIVPAEKYLERLDLELYHIHAISENLGQPLSDYFVTMSKIIDLVWGAGDSLVGVGRGSGVGSLVNYLLGITQLDPLQQELEMPFWRFMHESRPELPDIDFDTEANKRLKIFNAVQSYFNSINSEVINVCTFTTLGAKSAIKLAAKSLDVADTTANYLASMVPSERGKNWTLNECMFGDDEHSKINGFVTEMNKNKDLWNLANRTEGLIVNLGVHASGVLVLNGTITDHNSVMKTSSDVVVTAWELHDSEYCGGLKYDFLTIAALDKIRTCMNLLLENEKMKWFGTLKETYNHYLLPIRLDYHNPKIWELIDSGSITECFQFDTTVGSKAIRVIKPSSLKDLAAGNSIMRLMTEGRGVEQPLDIYVRHKIDITEWYKEMQEANLNTEEQKLMRFYLEKVYGVAGSQELVMMLSMDPHIANFTIVEANKLRKGIAKKKPELIEAIKKTFFEKGLAAGTREVLLDYVWDKQISMSLGYSFSDLHTTAYSTIALQEASLVYNYSDLYWKCSCLSVDADAIDTSDYEFLIENNIMEEESEEDEDDKKKSSKINYDKIASAIGKFSKEVNIVAPNINKSKIGFEPDVENNAIIFGLKGISKIGDNVIAEIMMRRPFASLNDFVEKMQNNGKKLISIDRVVFLIKSGCFDALEGLPREKIMENFLLKQLTKRETVDMKNAITLIRKGFIPTDPYKVSKGAYLLGRYFGRHKDGNGYFILDKDPSAMQEVWCEKFYTGKVYDLDGSKKVLASEWESFVLPHKLILKKYISDNKKELAEKLYQMDLQEIKNKYAKGDILQWELDSLNFYHSGHPLLNTGAPVEYEDINTIPSGDNEGFWGGYNTLKYKLHTIIGTVLTKNKSQCILSLSTPTGVIKVKLYKQQYAKYAQKIENSSGKLVQEAFTEKGTHLCIIGIKRDELFIPKVYKETRCSPIMKINLDENNKFIDFEEKL